MRHIREVVKHTVTPSWIYSVPHNFGDSAAGSLKADEWRSMSTIYLPLALVSLWGEGTSHASAEVGEKLRRILDHTMALVCAITIVCTRTVSQARAAAYCAYVATYIQDLQDLHPEATHHTNQHMAMHIYDFLQLFGPVHSWWCFPFERIIGQLQRTKINHRFGRPSLFYSLLLLSHSNTFTGQLESTMLLSFIRAGKLRRWLSRADCPPIIKECKILFDKVYAPKVRGDSRVDIEDNGADESVFMDSPPDKVHQTLQTVPLDLYPLVLRHKAPLHAWFPHHGVMYAASSAHLGNSLVHFYPQGNRTQSPIPGSIKYIFDKDGKTMFAIQRQLPPHHHIVNPFKPYIHFPVKLYSSSLADTLEAVHTDWVMCHFARWQMSPEHVAVLSLSRVSLSDILLQVFTDSKPGLIVYFCNLLHMLSPIFYIFLPYVHIS